MFGDPHLVTLDGHKYTFNGHGEFTLIQSLDKSLTIQVRMTEPLTNNASNQTLVGSGTVISAIVAKHIDSDTVQFGLTDDRLVAIVNGDEVDFSEISQLQFTNLTVTDKGNRTLSAVLAAGATITVQENNNFLSDLAVTLSDNYYRSTHGLLGNYNGKKEDDLQPSNVSASLPLNATLEEIHYRFGLTCKNILFYNIFDTFTGIIDDPNLSLFTYDEKGSWGTFYKPEYKPRFKAEFSDTELEEKAIEV